MTHRRSASPPSPPLGVVGSSENRMKNCQNRIMLSDLVNGQGYVKKPGDFIKVRILWSSGIKPGKNPEDGECDYIMADESGHIAAKQYLSKDNHSSLFNHNAINILTMLQPSEPKEVRIITGFTVKTTANSPPTSPGKKENENGFFIRGQPARILLSRNSADIIRRQDVDVSEYRNYLPFTFTEFMDIDDVNYNDTKERIVDIIGLVTAVDVKQYQKPGNGPVTYERVTLRSSRRGLPFLRQLAIFGEHLLQSVKPDAVFAFSNLMVDVYQENMSLKTTFRSLLVEITHENAPSLLSPAFIQSKMFQDLFPVKFRDFVYSPHIGTGLLPDDMSSLSLEESPAKRPRLLIKDEEAGVHSGEVARELADENRNQEEKEEELQLQPDFDSDIQVVQPVKRDMIVIPHEALEEDFTDSEMSELSYASQRRLEDAATAECEIYNFLANMKPLKVRVKRATKFMDTPRICYYMRSNPRGVALIIHNANFPFRESQPDRKGGVHDVLYLKEFLEQCAEFYVEVAHNVTSTELLNTITDFKKKVEKDYNEVDCCVVAILSHGSFESVQLVDGVSVTLHDSIIHQFNEQKFSVMKGKPKIVILQTCQDYWGDRPISLAQSQSNPFYLRNMIICYPTCPGSLSLRDVYLGSHFIFVLVHVLMNNAHCMEFQEMLEMVQKAVRKIKHDRAGEHPACTWTPYSFKKLYFNPGITTNRVKNRKRER